MAKVRLSGGKPILIGGKVALNDECCDFCGEEPPGATGACCLPDNSCAITTEAECALLFGVYQGDDVPCTPNPCPPCHSLTTCTVDFNFSYQDSPTPPIGHAFSGSGQVVVNISSCSGVNSASVFVTVTIHGEFGDLVCIPDAEVTLFAQAVYDPMLHTWGVEADVTMNDNSTICGPSGWPGVGIGVGDINTLTDGGGLLTLTGTTGFTGTAVFTFS